MQTCGFYIRNREANRKLNISWYGKKTPTQTYFGVILDRTLSYSTHIIKVKARNTALKKLSNSKWCTNPATTSALTALAHSYCTAEYECPVWERSAYAHKVNPVLNDACGSITGCLQPSNIDNFYLLSGIASPAIRRSVATQRER